MSRAHHRTPVWTIALLSLALYACEDRNAPDGTSGTGGAAAGGGGVGGGAGGGGPQELWPNVGCDPIQSFCGYPFPSNVYTVADTTTPTGRRVNLLEGVIPAGEGYEPSADPWSKADGFSPGGAILAFFDGATDAGLAPSTDPGASLDDDALTVLLDAETGERVPHWAELDKTTDELGQRSLLIKPAVRLEDARRYVVAVRGLVDEGGAPLDASEGFAALRDGTPSEEPSIEARRALYEDLFGLLGDAGVPKEDLLLAWDFTTASKESNTAWLLHMRDRALELVGDEPAFEITEVETEFDTTNAIARIRGTVEVPLFLSQEGPGGRLLFGDDGMPIVNAETPTHDVPFVLILPLSATPGTPAKLLQYGHGLLGSRDQIGSGHFRTFMNTYNYAMFAVDLAGMAEDDYGYIASKLAGGKTDELTAMFDRLHQGFVNYVVVMRMMRTSFVNDEDYGDLVDPSQAYYFGISQGGIMGGVYVTIAPDLSRGALEVMGQPYTTLLDRSVDFDEFFEVLRGSVPDARGQQLLLGLLQMTWDRVEPDGYTKYAVEGIDDVAGPKSVLMRAALGDHQVTTLGAHVMARTMGAKHVDTGLRDLYGLEKVSGPVTSGAAYLEYDFGLPADPVCNQPQRLCEDPHGKLRSLDAAREQLDTFLTTGVIENTCAGGVCDYTDMSGCVGGEVQISCE